LFDIVSQIGTFVATKLEKAWAPEMLVSYHNTLHGVTTQKTTTWNFTAVKTSKLETVQSSLYIGNTDRPSGSELHLRNSCKYRLIALSETEG